MKLMVTTVTATSENKKNDSKAIEAMCTWKGEHLRRRIISSEELRAFLDKEKYGLQPVNMAIIRASMRCEILVACDYYKDVVTGEIVLVELWRRVSRRTMLLTLLKTVTEDSPMVYTVV